MIANSKNCSLFKDKGTSLINIRKKEYEKLFHIRTESTTEYSSEDVEDDKTESSSTESSTETDSESCTESSNASDCLSDADTFFSDDHGHFDNLTKRAASLLKRNLTTLEVSSNNKDIQADVNVSINYNCPAKVKSVSEVAEETYSDDFYSSSCATTARSAPIVRRHKESNNPQSSLTESSSLVSEMKCGRSLKNPKRLTKNEYFYANTLVYLPSVSNCNPSCDVPQECSMTTYDKSAAVENKEGGSRLIKPDLTTKGPSNVSPLFYFYRQSENVDNAEDEEIQEFIHVPQDDDTLKLVAETCFNKTRSAHRVHKRINLTISR